MTGIEPPDLSIGNLAKSFSAFIIKVRMAKLRDFRESGKLAGSKTMRAITETISSSGIRISPNIRHPLITLKLRQAPEVVNLKP